MLFKDLSLGTSFFGVLPIVLPFRKALVSPVLLVPKYGLKTQWLINGSHRKRAKKNFVTFLRQSRFFFRPWLKGPQGGCIGPLKKNLCNGPWNTENFAKMYFFQKVTPHFFTFLKYTFKNLNFLLSEHCKILKFFLISKIAPWKNLRI